LDLLIGWQLFMLKLEDLGANVPARLFPRCCGEEASQPSITTVHFAAANNFTMDLLDLTIGEGGKLRHSDIHSICCTKVLYS
jgi:hypothetical protein